MKILKIVEKFLSFDNQQKGKGRLRMLVSPPLDLIRVGKVFDSKLSNCKVTNHLNLKILSPKQMIQRLPVALTQVKAGNTSENLLNETRKIICSLYREKEFTKKVYNNIMNSVKL